MSPPKPHLVLITGAWHTPAHYAQLTTQLEAHGYTVLTQQMPSVGNPNPPTDLTPDIAAVDALVTTAIADANDVLVLAHSWGGLIVGSALRGLSKAERAARGEKGGVVRCAYMAAFMVGEGFCWTEDMMAGGLCVVEDRFTRVRSPTPFYHDLPDAEQQHWFALARPHALATFLTPAREPSWMRIPSAYLLCVDDRAITEEVQEGMVRGAREMGASVEVTRIRSGHCPFLKCPDVVVEWAEGCWGGEGVSE